MGVEHPELAHWHGNVGEPIALDLAPAPSAPSRVVDVLSWNVAIGHGRLPEVVEKIRAGSFDGETRSSDRPLVVLVQEAYRADDSIPHELQSPFHGGKAPRAARNDIVDMAYELGFSLRYAPSMRNGDHRSDRGNAILSSAPITHWHLFTLPHVRQRRVVVAARISGLPGATFASAHLDTRGRVRETPMTTRYATGRTAQAAALAESLVQECGPDHTIVLGADLNTYLGLREPLIDQLIAHSFERVPHQPGGHTFHATPLRMLLDHVFLRPAAEHIESARVLRLDEDARDRGRRIFGSDHHPLMATIVFTEMKGAAHGEQDRDV